MINAALIINALQWYAIAGTVLAIAFLGYGISRVAPGAAGSYVFRVLLVPGVVLLWPVVAWRWQALARQRSDAPAADWQVQHRPRRRLHGWAARLLAIVLPLILLTSFMTRQNGPLETPAVLLEAPAR